MCNWFIFVFMNTLLKFETFEEMKAFDSKISTDLAENTKRLDELNAFMDYIKLNSIKVDVVDKSKTNESA